MGFPSSVPNIGGGGKIEEEAKEWRELQPTG